MRATRAVPRKPQGILDETRALGWGLLAEQPARFLVCGAICQPWLAVVVFSAVPPDEFLAYAQPDRVKIAWTLEAAEIGPGLTRFGQETRAVATDPQAGNQVSPLLAMGTFRHRRHPPADAAGDPQGGRAPLGRRARSTVRPCRFIGFHAASCCRRHSLAAASLH